jgi:hypothetical protein
MIYRLVLMILLVFAHVLNARSEEMRATESKLTRAFELLAQTKTGAAELKRAKEMHIEIIAGKVSKTDVSVTRSVQGDHENFQFLTKVIVDQEKEPVFQALDLAHELVHATEAKSNPFDPNLDATTYVKHGIEGAGGEAQAIANECAVGKELVEANVSLQMKPEMIQLIKVRCGFVWKTAANPSRWNQSFYFMGQYYDQFMKNVLSLNVDKKTKQAWFDKVEMKSPMFASAVAHKPYPLALLEEYVSITHTVCDRAKNFKVGRKIASLSLLKERCSAVGTELN